MNPMIVVLCAGALALAGCATGRPDRPLNPDGEWIQVYIKPGILAMQGQLLAVSEGSLVLLSRERALEIPLDEISEVWVFEYDVLFCQLSGGELKKLMPYARHGDGLKPDQRRELLARYRQTDFLRPPKFVDKQVEIGQESRCAPKQGASQP